MSKQLRLSTSERAHIRRMLAATPWRLLFRGLRLGLSAVAALSVLAFLIILVADVRPSLADTILLGVIGMPILALFGIPKFRRHVRPYRAGRAILARGSKERVEGTVLAVRTSTVWGEYGQGTDWYELGPNDGGMSLVLPLRSPAAFGEGDRLRVDLVQDGAVILVLSEEISDHP